MARRVDDAGALSEDILMRAWSTFQGIMKSAAAIPDYGAVADVVERAQSGVSPALGVGASADDIHVLIRKSTWPRALVFALQLSSDPQAAAAAILSTPQLSNEPFGPLEFSHLKAVIEALARSDSAIAPHLHVALAKPGAGGRVHVTVLPLSRLLTVTPLATVPSAAEWKAAVFIPDVSRGGSAKWMVLREAGADAAGKQRQLLADVVRGRTAGVDRKLLPASHGGRGLELRPTTLVMQRGDRSVCVLMAEPEDDELFTPGYDRLSWAEDTLAGVIYDADVHAVLPQVPLSSLAADDVATLRAQRYAALAAWCRGTHLTGSPADSLPARAAVPYVPSSEESRLTAVRMCSAALASAQAAVDASSAAGVPAPAAEAEAAAHTAPDAQEAAVSDAASGALQALLQEAQRAQAQAAAAVSAAEKALDASTAERGASAAAHEAALTRDAAVRAAFPGLLRDKLAALLESQLRGDHPPERPFSRTVCTTLQAAGRRLDDAVAFAAVLAGLCAQVALPAPESDAFMALATQIEAYCRLALLLAWLMPRADNGPARRAQLVFAMLSMADVERVQDVLRANGPLGHWTLAAGEVDVPGLLGAPRAEAAFSDALRARARVARVVPAALLPADAWLSARPT